LILIRHGRQPNCPYLLERYVYYTFVNSGEEEASIEYTTRHLELARAIGDMEGQALAFLFLSSQASSRGNLEDTDNYMKQAIDAYYQIDNALSHAKITGMRSNVFFMQGKFSRAKENFLWAKDALSDLGYFATHSYIYMFLGKIEGIQGDYQAGRKLLNHALTFPSGGRHLFHIYEGMALCSIGLNDFISVQQYISKALELDYTFIGVRHMINFLPQLSFLYHHDNQNEKAVALLGLTFSHPTGTTMWMEKWDLLTQLQADLKVELGEEAYHVAWERGKSLDLETVVQELVEKFGDKSD
jgi:tetratricopeptide (TPR) repeat protein